MPCRWRKGHAKTTGRIDLSKQYTCHSLSTSLSRIPGFDNRIHLLHLFTNRQRTTVYHHKHDRFTGSGNGFEQLWLNTWKIQFVTIIAFTARSQFFGVFITPANTRKCLACTTQHQYNRITILCNLYCRSDTVGKQRCDTTAESVIDLYLILQIFP